MFARHALALTSLLVLALVAVRPGPALGQADDRSVVTVGGEGTVRVQPDQATVRFGIVTQAETAEEARRMNARAARNAMNAVRDLDVPDEKMRMETLRLQPRREYNPDTKRYEEKGFEAQRQVVVEVDSLVILPQLVANVVQRGANRLDGISYGLSNRSGIRDEALREAALAARDKAQLLASTLDATLGPVYRINEQSFSFDEPRPRLAMAKMSVEDADSGEPDAYAAGEIEVSAQVQVVFILSSGAGN